jgi:hypothetical protein
LAIVSVRSKFLYCSLNGGHMLTWSLSFHGPSQARSHRTDKETMLVLTYSFVHKCE